MQYCIIAIIDKICLVVAIFQCSPVISMIIGCQVFDIFFCAMLHVMQSFECVYGVSSIGLLFVRSGRPHGNVR